MVGLFLDVILEGELLKNLLADVVIEDVIRCPGKRWFYLHKADSAKALSPRLMEPDGEDEAKILIVGVNWGDGGSYYCSYRPRSEVFVFSEASDNVELLVLCEAPHSTFPRLTHLAHGFLAHCVFTSPS
ncbi:hypothetical protein lerEdw1_020814 [Lerista edwardsae]|nr:hypothetical protein lerEdw1_020814 [Lerista edwardsae]